MMALSGNENIIITWINYLLDDFFQEKNLISNQNTLY